MDRSTLRILATMNSPGYAGKVYRKIYEAWKRGRK